MVTDSKQAKAAIIILLIILIFASAFVILNFKEVKAADEQCYGTHPDCGNVPFFWCSLAGCTQSGSSCTGSTAQLCSWYTDQTTCGGVGCNWGIPPEGEGEDTETSCTDKIDNDNDNKIDCKDIADCKGKSCGTLSCLSGSTGTPCTKICSDIGICGGCSVKDFCTETNCADGVDNDNDNKIDCLDPDCACKETNCKDKIDNDLDGAIDCEDNDCNTEPACVSAAGGYICIGTATYCKDDEDFCGATVNDPQYGCRWTGWGFDKICSGTPTPCGDLKIEDKCKNQDGCSWVKAGSEFVNTPFNVRTAETESDANKQSSCSKVIGASGVHSWDSVNAFCKCKGYTTAIPDKYSPCIYAPKKTLTTYAWDTSKCPPTQYGEKTTSVPLLSVECCRKNEAAEVSCSDGVDNDCDGLTDCGDTNCDNKQCGIKKCKAGASGECIKYCRAAPLTGCVDCSLTGKCTETNCADGVDNDDDKLIDCDDGDCSTYVDCIACIDVDEDGYGALGTDLTNCEFSEEDCNDNNIAVSPEASEICDNGIDDDCDGDIDDADLDCEEVVEPQCTSGETRSCGPETEEGECAAGIQTCADSGLWDVCKNAVYPADETCNQLDDDCDAIIDDVNGGESPEETQCACYAGADPKAQENTTNKIDDNCDGAFAPEEADLDKDGFAIFEGDCDDMSPVINPLAGELCWNRIDDNCNGEIDEGCSGTGGGGGHGGDGSRPTGANFNVGNGICEIGESAENACVDCGCASGKTCIDNKCLLINPAAAAAASKLPPPTTPTIMNQMSNDPFPFTATVLGVLLAILVASLGSYYFWYKPKEELEYIGGVYPTEQQIPTGEEY